jgi:2,3-bisphosphoglycerate-independent phosphoglycerate mutase
MEQKNKKQVVLVVLDGWGYREEAEHNAIAKAKTPVFDSIWQKFPHSLLEASGLAVGLPEGQMGNSEVGHSTIGAGRPLDTDLVRIGKSITSGEFENNPVFLKLFAHVKQNSSTLHVKGLIGNGGVHSHQDHLVAFLKAAKKYGIEQIAIHAFTDGRDTAPQSSAQFIPELEKVLEEVGIGKIATVSGRFYAMDRDNNWDRLAKAEKAIFDCEGHKCEIKISDYIKNLHSAGKLDEHLEPIVCVDENGQSWPIKENDAVLFFNFRADRARMLSQKTLERTAGKNILFATLTEYNKDFACEVAFPNISIETVLAKEISEAGLTQAHIAETEKFPHATYFLNGGKEEPHLGEKHILLDSRKDVPTHDLAPKMRAEGIADKAIEEIENGTNFIFINFANPDMVGHTANVPAIIEALEEVDAQLGRVLKVLAEKDGIAFVTADHGNAEVNIDPKTGEKHTSHTINPVPAVLTDPQISLKNGTLADIAPTILSIFGLTIPQSMTGKNLIE